jgi:hypothetical protein
MFDVCKSCGRTIRWARTRADRRIPLEPKPAAGGNVILQEGVALVLGPAALALLDEYTPRWVPHHATCPNGAAHRKPKEAVRGDQ